MSFQPLGKRVLVKRVEEEAKTASGIIIPDSAKEKPLQAKVIAVSEKVKNISVDDTVVFGKFGGSELTLDGEEFLVLNSADIFGIIK